MCAICGMVKYRISHYMNYTYATTLTNHAINQLCSILCVVCVIKLGLNVKAYLLHWRSTIPFYSVALSLSLFFPRFFFIYVLYFCASFNLLSRYVHCIKCIEIKMAQWLHLLLLCSLSLCVCATHFTASIL